VAINTDVRMLTRSTARFVLASIVDDVVEEVCEERSVLLGRALALVAAHVLGSVYHQYHLCGSL
jgi:hypothetical protein